MLAVLVKLNRGHIGYYWRWGGNGFHLALVDGPCERGNGASGDHSDLQRAEELFIGLLWASLSP